MTGSFAFAWCNGVIKIYGKNVLQMAEKPLLWVTTKYIEMMIAIKLADTVPSGSA